MRPLRNTERGENGAAIDAREERPPRTSSSKKSSTRWRVLPAISEGGLDAGAGSCGMGPPIHDVPTCKKLIDAHEGGRSATAADSHAWSGRSRSVEADHPKIAEAPIRSRLPTEKVARVTSPFGRLGPSPRREQCVATLNSTRGQRRQVRVGLEQTHGVCSVGQRQRMPGPGAISSDAAAYHAAETRDDATHRDSDAGSARLRAIDQQSACTVSVEVVVEGDNARSLRNEARGERQGRRGPTS